MVAFARSLWDQSYSMGEQDALGDRIRAAYEAAGLNRSQFVRALGVAYSTVLHWEKGRTRPNADNLRRISEVTGLAGASLLRTEALAPGKAPAARSALMRFLATPMGRACSGEERTFLSNLDFAPAQPTLESYHAALLAYRLSAQSES